MLTPQDIQDVKFVKSMKGYDKDQVESFLDQVHEDYTALYKENATLKGKMRVLVDKIEEYRSVDEQMRKAFYSAQVTAKETVSKAEAEAEKILRNARQEAEGRVNDIRMQIEAEEKRLEMARSECLKYAQTMKELLGKNISFIDILMEKSGVQLAKETAPAAPQTAVSPAPEQNIRSEAVHIDDEPEEDTAEFAERLMKQPAAPAAAQRDIDDSGRFVFSDIRFGKNYKEEDD